MYLSDQFVDEILKCSFCSAKFTGVIKLIPECGSSICGKCYDGLRDQKAPSDNFDCKECKRRHPMPSSGLGDNKTLVMMLASQSGPAADQLKTLRPLLDELQSKIEGALSLDKEQEVNEFCDALQKEVMAAIDEAFAFLNKTGNDLLSKINEYRESLLGTKERPAKRLKCGDGSECKRRNSEEESTIETELATLSKEIRQYSSNGLSSIILADSASTKIKEFQSKFEHLHTRRKLEVFKGKLMRFKPNQLFCSNSGQFGALEFDSLNENDADSSQVLLSKSITKMKAKIDFHAHGMWVRQVAFLTDDTIASCSCDKAIRIWSCTTGTKLYELVGDEKIYSIAALSSGLLAAGTNDNRISIWDLNKRTLIRTLQGHTHTICCLKTLPNGNLVSCSWDETIRVWDPYGSGPCLVATISGHGVRHANGLTISPTGRIVFCAKNKITSTNVIQEWTADGELIRFLPVDFANSTGVLCLQDERVVVALSSGQIKIFDLAGKEDTVSIEKSHDGEVCSLAESSQGLLFTGGPARDPTIKVWETKTGSLIQTIPTGHSRSIFSIGFSNDSSLLASGSFDNTVNIYDLN